MNVGAAICRVVREGIFEKVDSEQRHRQREKQAPCGEPDARLDPRTPRSRPGQRADAPPLSPLGVPFL